MALAKDRPEWSELGRYRAMDADFRAGKKDRVLYLSDFDRGFDNWTDHWDAFRPLPPLSLTNHAAHLGARSLMLSTSEGAYVTGSIANGNNAFRRMTRTRGESPAYPDQDRFASVSAYLGLGIGGYSSSWGEFALFIDTNAYDNSQRSFFRLLCNARPSPDWTRWQIAATSSTAVTIPDSEHIWHGDNDNKTNFGYVRLTIDRAANSGLGGYHEAQIGPHLFDLTGLGGGSAPEPSQSEGQGIQEFNGGDNIGFGISRNSGIAGGCQLFVSAVAYTVRDEA